MEKITANTGKRRTASTDLRFLKMSGIQKQKLYLPLKG
jgi:hypothetical protein